VSEVLLARVQETTTDCQTYLPDREERALGGWYQTKGWFQRTFVNDWCNVGFEVVRPLEELVATQTDVPAFGQPSLVISRILFPCFPLVFQYNRRERENLDPGSSSSVLALNFEHGDRYERKCRIRRNSRARDCIGQAFKG
jgi:hypothetical protein